MTLFYLFPFDNHTIICARLGQLIKAIKIDLCSFLKFDVHVKFYVSLIVVIDYTVRISRGYSV